MNYKQTPFDVLQNTQPNAILKVFPDEPNKICWINLDVESSEKEEYLAWLAEGNTPLPAD
jgi:hypothetical protein